MSLSKPCRFQVPSVKYNFRNFNPCGVCAAHCDTDNLILKCDICTKSFHRSCKNVSKKRFRDLEKNNKGFICSNKCELSVLPFFSADKIDFFSALFGEGEYPCKKCKRDCLNKSACFQCSNCDKWCHFECSDLTAKEFKKMYIYFAAVNVKFYFA